MRNVGQPQIPIHVPGSPDVDVTRKSRLESGWRFWAVCVAIAVTTFIAYYPALNGTPLWDDHAHLTPPAMQSSAGLARIWSELGATQQYYPLLHSAFWFEHYIWGDNMLAYHVTNVALHLLAAGLFVIVLRTLAIPGALLAGAIFALHPVHVESVAWITEQKNTLSTVFYLGAALAYLRFDQQRRRFPYAIALALFACALLTKSVTATLPAALLVVVWWQRGRLEWRRDILPLIPFFIVAISSGLFTAWVERAIVGAHGAAYELAAGERIVLAGRVIAFYVGKLVWPTDLMFFYPRWDPAVAVLTCLPLTAVGAVTAVLWWVRKWSRAPLAAWLFFTGSLFPVLGFFNVFPFKFSFVADHFQYLPSLGMIALAAAGLHKLTTARRHTGAIIAVVLLLLLGKLAWAASRSYKDSETLFRDTIARNPTCWVAYSNLGTLLLSEQARLPEAVELLARSIELYPDNAEARNSLGWALFKSGRANEAIPHLHEAIRLKRSLFQAHNNLGIVLASTGRPQDALAAFREAARFNPTSPIVHENWGKALQMLGRNREANERFQEAARLRGEQAQVGR